MTMTSQRAEEPGTAYMRSEPTPAVPHDSDPGPVSPRRPSEWGRRTAPLPPRPRLPSGASPRRPGRRWRSAWRSLPRTGVPSRRSPAPAAPRAACTRTWCRCRLRRCRSAAPAPLKQTADRSGLEANNATFRRIGRSLSNDIYVMCSKQNVVGFVQFAIISSSALVGIRLN